MLAAPGQNTARANTGASDGSSAQRAIDIERLQADAERRGEVEFPLQPGESRLIAIELQPAGLAQIALRTGVPHQRSRARRRRWQTAAASDAPTRISRSGREAARNAISQGATRGRNDR